jgi:hypothetical protein
MIVVDSLLSKRFVEREAVMAGPSRRVRDCDWRSLTPSAACRLVQGLSCTWASAVTDACLAVRHALPRSADAVDAARRPNGLLKKPAPSG